MKTLIERASHLLELAENSQKELARIAGVKPPSVNDWLSGKSKSIQLEPATRLGKRFGLNPMWISKGVGPMLSGEPPQETIHLAYSEPKEVADRRAALSRRAVNLAALFDMLPEAGKFEVQAALNRHGMETFAKDREKLDVLAALFNEK